MAAAEGVTPGSRIAGYRVEKQIGRGGMAVVFRAYDERLGRQVALKVLASALAAEEAFRQRFIRESRAAARVDDPHIIPVFEAGEAGGVLFIAMRYVRGGDVRTLVRRAGPLSAARAAAIISPVASALDAAHGQGLVHRDVKPANMLLDVRHGRPDHVYLSDFGLSKAVLSSADLTGSGVFLGTPDYVSPEQIAGRPADGRADQYALGCAAFELLSGAPPFQRDHGLAVIYAHSSQLPPALTSRRPELPQAVDAVLAKALAKAPTDRYATCCEFAESLQAALWLPPYDFEPETTPEGHQATVAVRLAEREDGDRFDRRADPPGSAETMTRGGQSKWQSGLRRALSGHSGSKVPGPLAGSADQDGPVQVFRPKGSLRRRAALAATGAVLLIGGASGITLWAHARGSTALPQAAGNAERTHATVTTWSRASSPGGNALLEGVSTGPDTNAWAVGDYGHNQALILRWNGAAWSRTASPSPGIASFLSSVSTGPGGSAWAVGEQSTPSGAWRALILHWNGAAWSRTASPSPGGSADLFAVSTGPAGSAWAVGDTCTSSCNTPSETDQILILRWNGAAWSQVASPSPRGSAALLSVSTGPGDSAWAVGRICIPRCGTSSIDRTLILHWNGAAWSQVASPSPRGSAELVGVSAGSDGSAWAVGNTCKSNCGTTLETDRTLIMHWNGTTWSQIATPSYGNASLEGVTTASSSSAWAVGDIKAETLIMHWNGTAWSRVASPSYGAVLYAVSAGTGGGAWAVGDTKTGTLILHHTAGARAAR